MLSPRGEGPRADVGHLITFAISTLGNLTESLGPRVGTFDFFGEDDWALIACCLKAAILNHEESRHCCCRIQVRTLDKSCYVHRCYRFFQKFNIK